MRPTPVVIIVADTEDFAADRLVAAIGERDARCVRLNQDNVDQFDFTWTDRGGLIEVGNGQWSLGGDRLAGAWFRRILTPTGEPWAEAFRIRQWGAALAGMAAGTRVRPVNDPRAALSAENKLHQLVAARASGLTVPRTLVTNSADEARMFAEKGPTIAKAVVSGGGTDDIGRFMLPTVPVVGADLTTADVALAPLILQENVPVGRHLRVTCVDDRCFGVAIDIRDRQPEEVDWRVLDDTRLAYSAIDLSPRVEAALGQLLSQLGLRFGAIDLIERPNGEPVFLEINPSGQWGWLEHQTEQPITSAIVDALLGETK